MFESRIEQLESKVSRMEEFIRSLDSRVTRMEPRTHIPMPPVQNVQPMYEIPAPRPMAQPPTVAREDRDAEFELGTKWLPRIGAGLLILGIAYLIGLAVNRGWITPPMLFSGAILLCLSFIGVGQKLRDEKEDFGQILTGIGSCGMFATLAGGHVYQNLYSGEVLVGTFIAWSLANLGYAMWRESRSFLAIGIIGGFIGSVMPMSKEAHVLTLSLHAIILAVSSVIIVRQKLTAGALGLAVASGLALAPVVIQTQLDWRIRIAAIYISAFACLISYLQARLNNDPVEVRLVNAVFLGSASLFSFALMSGLEGAIQLLIASSAMAVLAWFYRRDSVVRDSLLWTALIVSSVLAPQGLHTQAATLLYAGLSAISGIAGSYIKNKLPVYFATLYVSGSALMLFASVVDMSGLPVPMEAAMHFALLLAVAILARAIGKDETEPCLLVGFLVGWGTFARLGAILLALPSDFKLANASVTLACVLYGAGILTIGFLASLRNYRYAGLIVLLTTVAKVLLVDMATSTPELRVGILILLGLVLLIGGYGYIKRRQRQLTS